MATTHAITSAQDLLQAGGLGPCELIRGQLIMMTPAGFQHGQVASTVNLLVASFVRQRGLGVVTGAETGFQIAREPDTVRAPDVAFVRADRISQTLPEAFFQGAPDLAVEVLSPGDRASDVLQKVQDWLGAGSRLVWIVDPRTRTVTAYQGGGAVVALSESDMLDGGDTLPEFRVAVADIFA